MFRMRHRAVRAAGLTVAVAVAVTGLVSTRAAAGLSPGAAGLSPGAAGLSPGAAGLSPGLAISGPVTLEYTATTSDTDSCTGRCDESLGLADWSPYTRKATGKLTGQATFTVSNGTTKEGSGPLTEAATYNASGSFTNMDVVNCWNPHDGSATEVLTGTTPGTLTVNSLQVITNASGHPDLQLSAYSEGGPYENTLDTYTGGCPGSFPFIELTALNDIYDVAAADGLNTNEITGWKINPAWTPQEGGTLATKTLTGSVPQPAIGGPDAGTVTATQTWTLVTKSSGLQITSPPDNSTIAVTDGTYVQPQPGPANDVAPAHRYLIVDGTTQCPDVTVNGVAASVSGDTWQARVPIGSLGPLTLTAEASSGNIVAAQARAGSAGASCGQATSTVTLINLKITSPADDGDALPVTAQPAMPALDAQVQVEGYPGDTSAVPFNWTLDISGQYKDRVDWHGYDRTFTGSQTGTSSSWSPQFPGIVGGWGRLVVTADLPGVLDGPVRSDPRWADIAGTNPGKAAVLLYIAAHAGQFADTVAHIDCWESGRTFHQFKPFPNRGEPQTAGVPHSLPNPAPFRPMFGADPAGIGIAQLDPATFPFENWNWKLNVSTGIDEFEFDYATASTLRDRTQAALDAQYSRLLKTVNAKRAQEGMSLLKANPETVPALTDEQILYDAIRLYNYSGGEYLFDLHYQEWPDLTIKPIGTGTWVHNTGGPDPAYVHEVLTCLY